MKETYRMVTECDVTACALVRGHSAQAHVGIIVRRPHGRFEPGMFGVKARFGLSDAGSAMP